ncbi:unnamed protein product [Sphagnum balticum]
MHTWRCWEVPACDVKSCVELLNENSMNSEECSKTFLSLCHHIVAGHDYHMGSLCIIPEDTSTTLFPQIHLRCAITQLCSSNSLSSQLGVALGTDGGNCHVLYLAWHHSFVHRPRKLTLFYSLNFSLANHIRKIVLNLFTALLDCGADVIVSNMFGVLVQILVHPEKNSSGIVQLWLLRSKKESDTMTMWLWHTMGKHLMKELWSILFTNNHVDML